MTTIRFLHAADLHLDSPLRGLEADPGAPVEQIRGATRRALERLVDLALVEDVAFVLIAGDIYDGDWPDYGTGLFFGHQMARLARAGKRVFAIRGNHDAQNRITRSLRLPDGVRLLPARRPETVELPDLGIAVHGQSFAAQDVTDNLMRAYPKPVAGLVNIGLLHTCLEQVGGPHPRYAPCTRAELTAHGYEYWALGHIHAREVVCENPWIVFPGNLQGRHVNETGAKGATLVTVAEGRVVAAEHRALDDFRWARLSVDLTGLETEEAALAEIATRLGVALDAAGGRGLAARVTLTGATILHGALAGLREKLVNEARMLSALFWIEGVEIRTRPARPAALAARGDALGALARRIATLAEAPPEALLAEWPAQLLGRLPPGTLPPEHPLHDPAQVLARARDLLLARLEEG
ncbi:DNA repair exonuclease family protein YhaO [Rhodovastum atsumiense]|uniref:metallophosphoesterase family protein n=1 Tax=Rhodovastum atsumiense TaxID=504468 RepID=UPI00139F2BA7|nr:DNA repair exonuclease [Rhodovastum atsumiense]CAH2601150.1 DNA repair exonuclease family protein YhaO [Rhodovastum atsumiense]